MEAKLILTEQQVDSGFMSHFSQICRAEFGEEIYKKWFATLELFSDLNSEIILAAPSKFVRDWIIREFVETKILPQLLQKIRPSIKKVTAIYVAKPDLEQTPVPSPSAEKVLNLSKHDNVFAFGTELKRHYNFENFISAKYNKFAVSMARIAAGIDAQTNLFEDRIPLFIHGGVGMGKTHLAQAIAWQIKEFDKSKKLLYLSAEKFMYHFVQSIRSNDAMSFKEKMRSIDVLIVDDLQFIAGKETTQQEFMHCFNALVDANKQVVMVCDRRPSDLENVDEKLKSRIAGGMIVNFKNPDYTDRLAILKAKSRILGHEICENTMNFIAENVTGSVRDLEGILKKLIAEKIFAEREITIESAREALKSYANITKVKSTAELIQKTVADFYGITLADLTSRTRERKIARPRQIAMYLTKTHTGENLPKIGKIFGGKNHATVIHAVKLVKQMIETDKMMMQEVRSLEEKIKN
ncbi:MAG: chromosomal replication initiator protein DnaA [Alphaproteobacteria bacterium]|nr:chromosomal replication initiator protein DnaA [Alphaproteobacteria bacterium]